MPSVIFTERVLEAFLITYPYKVRVVQTDNGSEFMGEFDRFLEETSIVRKVCDLYDCLTDGMLLYILRHTMSYAVITTKIDPQTKREAQRTAEALGMPLSVVIKAFLKHFIRTKSVEFSAREEEPNEYLKSVMRQAEENYRKGNVSPVFHNAKDAIKYLEDQGI